MVAPQTPQAELCRKEPLGPPPGRPDLNVHLVRFDQIPDERESGLALPRLGADPDRLDVIEAGDHTLGEQKAKGQLEVVPGGAHDDAQGLSIEEQLQRLLRRDAVVVPAPFTIPKAADAGGG